MLVKNKREDCPQGLRGSQIREIKSYKKLCLTNIQSQKDVLRCCCKRLRAKQNIEEDYTNGLF
ncbi:hypothetical protein [Paenibacillus sp. P46E]|uniref:hypothetical protein n=1 Tax=Paenibacillus sp. P46E TaxID=1349436 RepID=UPI00093EB7CC|nr:hypothetical protein [Paenibacillus sp. P46E]OKP96643.1 hypothetical protein A3849_20075 [Paenibacillus sp. P46E]